MSNKQIKEFVEKKYAVEKKVLLEGYQRVLTELEVHEKQRDSSKYMKMLRAYGDGVDEFTLQEEDKQSIQTVYERNRDK